MSESVRSRLVELSCELAIGIVAQLGGDDRPLPREEQELQIFPKGADLIGGQQGAADMLRAEGNAGFLASIARLIVSNTTVSWPSRSETSLALS